MLQSPVILYEFSEFGGQRFRSRWPRESASHGMHTAHRIDQLVAAHAPNRVRRPRR